MDTAYPQRERKPAMIKKRGARRRMLANLGSGQESMPRISRVFESSPKNIYDEFGTRGKRLFV